MTAKVGLSAIVPVTERLDDVEEVYRAYKEGVKATGTPYEFVYVLDGAYPEALAALEKLKKAGEPIRIVTLAKWFGEATALSVGFANSTGDVILTLSAYMQVRPDEIPRIVAALEGADMVVARRHPRRDSWLNKLQSKAFNALVRMFVDIRFHDLGCGVRAMRRRVVEEVNLYGEQHRFLPILAHRLGLRVIELDVAQADKDLFRRVYPFGVYLRRLLDILTIVFLVKFTRKPLRFFGLIGVFSFLVGLVGTSYLIVERLFFGVGLADRPALILGALMVVLGIQIIAVGLIGELIIFTNLKDQKEYTIEKVIN